MWGHLPQAFTPALLEQRGRHVDAEDDHHVAYYSGWARSDVSDDLHQRQEPVLSWQRLHLIHRVPLSPTHAVLS